MPDLIPWGRDLIPWGARVEFRPGCCVPFPGDGRHSRLRKQMAEREQTIEDREGKALVSRDERLWALFAHLGGLATTVILPLIVYIVKKDDSDFVAEQAREALNFQMTVLLVGYVSTVIVCAAPLLVGIVVLFDFIFCLVGTIRAYDGNRYRYPLSIRLIH